MVKTFIRRLYKTILPLTVTVLLGCNLAQANVSRMSNQEKLNSRLPWTTLPSKERKFTSLSISPDRETYIKALEYLDVEHSNRYGKKALVTYKNKNHLIPSKTWDSWKGILENKVRYKTTYTYCNIYSWDATYIMGVEIPHWVGNKEMNANATYKWLQNSNDWVEVTYNEAIENAKLGIPTVVSYYNTSGRSGHLAMVSPKSTDKMYVYQAGSTNSNHLIWNHKNSTKYYSYSYGDGGGYQ